MLINFMLIKRKTCIKFGPFPYYIFCARYIFFFITGRGYSFLEVQSECNTYLDREGGLLNVKADLLFKPRGVFESGMFITFNSKYNP